MKDAGSLLPARDPQKLDRVDFACVLLILLLAIGTWLPRMAGPLDLRWDAGVYYVLGTSIYEGRGYRLLNEPGEIQAIQYPPLFPAIIALHQAAVGTSDPVVVARVMRWSWIVLSAAYLAGVFLLARRYLRRGFAFGVTLILLLNVQWIFLSDLCFAELPFATLTLLFFLVYDQKGRTAQGVAGVAAMASYLARSIGVALLATWVLDAARQREYKAAALRAAIAMIPILAWYGYIGSVETSPSYQAPAYEYQRAPYLFYNVSYRTNVALKDPFHPDAGQVTPADAVLRLLRNLRKVPFGMAESVTSGATLWYPVTEWIGIWTRSWVAWLAVRAVPTVVGLVTAWGLVRLYGVTPAMAMYSILSLMAVASSPWPTQYLRYLSPLTPILAIALMFAIGIIAERLRALPWLPAVRFLPAGILCWILVQQGIGFHNLFANDQRQVTLTTRNGEEVRVQAFYYTDTMACIATAYDWLAKHAAPGDIVAASMPQSVYLWTGLKAVSPPFETDHARTRALLAGVPVRYLLLDDLQGGGLTQFAGPAVETSPDWRLAFRPDAHCRVFERPGPDRSGRQ